MNLLCAPSTVTCGQLGLRDLTPAGSAATLAEQQGGWLDALAADVDADRLTPEQADVLAETLAAYQGPSVGAELDGSKLQQILADLHVWEPETTSLWQRFQDWLGSLLSDGTAFNLNPEWIEALLQLSAAEWVWRLCMVAFLAAAVIVVVNEIRQSHWRPRRPQGAVALPADLQTTAPALSWQDIDALPLHQRPSAILRLVLSSLDADVVTFSSAGDTHRDIALASARLGAARGASLRQLAKGAERTRFGGWRPNAEEGERFVLLGREILAPAATTANANAKADEPAQ